MIALISNAGYVLRLYTSMFVNLQKQQHIALFHDPIMKTCDCFSQYYTNLRILRWRRCKWSCSKPQDELAIELKSLSWQYLLDVPLNSWMWTSMCMKLCFVDFVFFGYFPRWIVSWLVLNHWWLTVMLWSQLPSANNAFEEAEDEMMMQYWRSIVWQLLFLSLLLLAMSIWLNKCLVFVCTLFTLQIYSDWDTFPITVWCAEGGVSLMNSSICFLYVYLYVWAYMLQSTSQGPTANLQINHV